MFRFLSVSLVALATATPALAQTTDLPGEDIVVLASGIAQPREEAGQAISVLDAVDLERRQTQQLADILQTLPGVAVARNGGPGAPTSIFIRGGDSSQTLVLVDGVRINDPSAPSGAFDFGNLLVGNIDRVELLRGPNSVIWGSQAIGGVVNVVTAPPTETLQVRARGEYGYRDTAQGVANVSGTSGILSGSVGGGYYRTDGISAYDEALGATERDGFENWQANGKLLVTLAPGINIDLRGFYTDSRVAFDNPPGDTSPVTDTEQFVGYVGLNAALLGGRFTNRLAYTRTDVERITTDAAPDSFNPFEARGTLDRFEYRGAFDVSRAITLLAGVEHEQARASTFSPPFDTAPDETEVGVTSYYGQAIVRPFAGLTLTGGARVDDQEIFGSNTSLGGNIAYTPNDGATVLRATYAEGFRAPALSELLAQFGNRDLQPETAESFDVGVEQRLLDGRMRAHATYFQRDTKNLIVYSGVTFTLENVAAARSQGVEAGIWLNPVDGFVVQANYTYLDAENRSREPDFSGAVAFGNELARRPRDTLALVADWETNWGPAVGATLRIVGDSFDNAANTVRLDGYAVADIRASMAVTDNVEVYGRIENLFDEAYQVVFNYGTPGRAGYAGVRLKI